MEGAANEQNRKVPRWCQGPCLRPAVCFCGLCAPWAGERVFVNPPYGRGLIEWVRKFARERDVFSVMLLPANTDTAWFAELWKAAHEIWFLTGRVNFVGSRGGNTGGSLLALRYPCERARCHEHAPNSDPKVSLTEWRS